MENEKVKEKKSKAWIIILIITIIIMIAGFLCGFLFKEQISNLFKKQENTTSKSGYIDIWYGKRIAIEYDDHHVVTDIMGGLVGNDDSFNQEIKSEIVDKGIDSALNHLANVLFTKKIITDSDNVLFADTYEEEDAAKLIKVFEKAFIDKGLKSVNIIHFKDTELTKEAKEYAQTKDVNLSRINYISMIAKQENKTIDTYTNKTNKELFVLYSDSGRENTNTTTNTTTNTNTGTNTTTSKCNSGYVYVSDDKRCYNNKKTTSPVTPNCEPGYTKLGPDCGKVVDSSYCESNPDDYSMQGSQCFDNSTIYNNMPQCPKGYEYLWGNYGGQTFNGDCYAYENPNY